MSGLRFPVRSCDLRESGNLLKILEPQPGRPPLIARHEIDRQLPHLSDVRPRPLQPKSGPHARPTSVVLRQASHLEILHFDLTFPEGHACRLVAEALEHVRVLPLS